MAKLWKQFKTLLTTEIEINWTETAKGSVDSVKQLIEFAKAVKENKTAQELAPLVNHFGSLLDVLNSPLGQVAGASLPFVSIATGIISFIVEKTKKELTIDESIELISQLAYLESLQQFFKTHPHLKDKLKQTPASDKMTREIKKLGDELELDEKEAKDTLVCFHDSKLAKAYNPILQQRLQESGLEEKEAKIITERISRQTYRYLKGTFVEIRDKVPRLDRIYGSEWQREIEIENSINNYLEDVIKNKPLETVFDQPFSFQDIYVPLEVKAVKDGEIDQNAQAENIEQWAANLLQNETQKKPVIFIQGGPGRGKSVFCRMFSDWVRRELYPIYIPILIRLRDLTIFEKDFDKTLAAAVGRDFVTSDSGWLTDRNTRFLFLLDGFDELLLERGVSSDLRDFLEQVANFQKRSAENNERGHQILITGRPLSLYGIDRLMPTNLARVEIIPMSEEIQGQWLEKWREINQGVGGEVNPSEAFKAFLQDQRCPNEVKTLAKEPLLLYLLAVMHRDGQITVEMFENVSESRAKVLIYEKAIDWVLEKQRSQDGDNLNRFIADSEDLRSILAEAGLCVVQSGREYAAIKMIESRLADNEVAKEILEAARKQDQENPLKNALATFYIKSVANADNCVEFLHKSFGEFLCAERMVESLGEWTNKSNKRSKKYEISDQQLEWEFYDLFGYGHLTSEIVGYIMALVEQGVDEGEIDIEVLFERLKDFYWRWSGGEYIEATEETLPQKKARQLKGQKIESGQRQVDIYTGLNSLILLFELHRYGQQREELKDKILFHPCGNRDNKKEFDRSRLLKIIGYGECLGASTFNEELRLFLRGAYLRGADLSGAYLNGCDLYGADLSGADLRGSHLSGADLSEADLSGAYLMGADLSEADLSGAYLMGADLSRANPVEAYLSGADLSKADLSGADLSGADLSGADLSEAYLSGANLIGADLSRADLTNIQWNQYTKWANAFNLDQAFGRSDILSQNPKFAAAVELSKGYRLVEERKIEEAITAYNNAQQLDPTIEIDIEFYNNLCWYGSLWGHAADVLDAGEKAVELEPNDVSLRDTRGLARALTGDIQGAVEDFQAALDGGVFDEDEAKKQKRQGWLEALRQGVNPFTSEELAALRGEEG